MPLSATSAVTVRPSMESPTFSRGGMGSCWASRFSSCSKRIQHAEHAHHQRGGVVAAAGCQRRLHQRLAQACALSRVQVCKPLAPACTPWTPSDKQDEQSPTCRSPWM